MPLIEHRKNAAFYLAFPMISATNPESYLTGLSPTDTAFSKDGAGAWTSLAIADTAAEIGTTGIYEIDLTAAELNHDLVLIKFTAAGAVDDAYMFDLGGSARQAMTVQLPAALVGGRMDADVGAMQANVVTASALATDAAQEIRDAIRDLVIEGSTSLQTVLQRLNSMARGKITVSGNNYAFRNEADTATLFTLTIGATERTTA